MITIMVVEDDPNQRLLYAEELREEGYRVICARDGGEAVDLVSRRRPSLVVLDISMPGMDGIEAMSRLLAKDHKLPIILNTAYATYKENFRAWSADAYVVKSSDLTELKQTIKRVLAARAADLPPLQPGEAKTDTMRAFQAEALGAIDAARRLPFYAPAAMSGPILSRASQLETLVRGLYDAAQEGSGKKQLADELFGAILEATGQPAFASNGPPAARHRSDALLSAVPFFAWYMAGELLTVRDHSRSVDVREVIERAEHMARAIREPDTASTSVRMPQLRVEKSVPVWTLTNAVFTTIRSLELKSGPSSVIEVGIEVDPASTNVLLRTKIDSEPLDAMDRYSPYGYDVLIQRSWVVELRLDAVNKNMMKWGASVDHTFVPDGYKYEVRIRLTNLPEAVSVPVAREEAPATGQRDAKVTEGQSPTSPTTGSNEEPMPQGMALRRIAEIIAGGRIAGYVLLLRWRARGQRHNFPKPLRVGKRGGRPGLYDPLAVLRHAQDYGDLEPDADVGALKRKFRDIVT